MKGYLGEKVVQKEKTKFAKFSKSDWVMYFIEMYGHIDGSFHKQWVLDQIARILKGTKIIIKLAEWSNGDKEYRIRLDEPSKEYEKWVIEMCDGEDGPETYSYDKGIAP
jgi:hypothetical protein